MHMNPPCLENFYIQNPKKPPLSAGYRAQFLTTQNISAWPQDRQDTLAKELSLFFPTIFKDKKDWAYMVRHFFYCPKPPALRQAVFIRDFNDRLIGLCAFDNGFFQIQGKPTHLVYIHIRALLPGIQNQGMGRLFSQTILQVLKPDLLMTTCVQLSSLYSWLRIKDPDIINHYQFYPHQKIKGNEKITHCLPREARGFALDCFKKIYISHVKEDNRRLNQVVRAITGKMVRKGVTSTFDHPKWDEKGARSSLARKLDVTDDDAILLVIKKKDRLAPCGLFQRNAAPSNEPDNL